MRQRIVTRRSMVVRNIKSRIAITATVLALGGLTGLALSTDKQKTPATVAADPLVRTKVIHRTIHITKHTKPRNPAGSSAYPGTGAGPAPEASPVAASSYSTEAPSATTATSGAGSYPESAPVTTATSGGGGGYASEPAEDGGGVEHENEGGADD
jgi:hypothetical protein